MKNPFVHPHLTRRDLRLIGWSVRGFDATRNDENAVVRRIGARVTSGAIVVMHQGRTWSVRTVSRVVDELLGQGYTFVVPGDSRLKTNR
jgi:peptidoglycan/xylan/chitin deacetylase (PgdA/CDA1 family)